MDLGETEQRVYLSKLGIDALNEMQLCMQQEFQSGHNISLTAPTGSGKTLAFLLPALAHLDRSKKYTQVLIVSPTRELAIQINDVLKTMGTGVSVVLSYGGHPIRLEESGLRNDPQIVIGSPGRLCDHLRRGNLKMSFLKLIVLDEYDKTLELGFENDVQSLIQSSGAGSRLLLTSATKGIELPSYLTRFELKELDFVQDKGNESKLKIFKVYSLDKDKIEVLVKLLCQLGNTTTLVFLNHRQAVERVHGLLQKRSVDSAYFHGGLDQVDRELTLLKFRNGSARILVTTDLSSRGLDIAGVDNVVHYQLPSTEEPFIHRNGRTARMNTTGNAFVIVSDKDEPKSYFPGEFPELVIGESSIPPSPEMTTLELNRGKRDKISKMDVLGFLTKVGGLNGDQVGLIAIKTRNSYVAVRSEFYTQVLKHLHSKKIKGKSVKINKV